MLPDGWLQAKVGDLLSGMDAGVSVNSKERPATSNELGVLKTSCVTNGSFNPSKSKLVDDPDEISRLKEPVSANTIIMSRMNTPDLVGASGYVESDYPNLFLPDRLWALKAKKNKADCRWLYIVLASSPTRFRISNLATGTSGSMKNITKSDVRSLPILLPPLDEQRKIAKIWGTWDQAIETVEALIANSQAQKKVMMQQLLTGKRRLPGFSGEWRNVVLAELGEFKKGKGIAKAEVKAQGIPCIRYGEIYTRHAEYIREFYSFIDETAAEQSQRIFCR